MLLHNFILGGVEVTRDAAWELTQDYSPVEGGRALRRKASGAAFLQTAWAKVRTVLRGSGRVPEGLDGLDYTSSMTLQCMAPRSIRSASNVIALPSSRRTDWAPHGYAIVDGRSVRTSITIATDTATLATVSGASGYVVAYYPVMTVYASPPVKTFNGRGGMIGWEITAEEA